MDLQDKTALITGGGSGIGLGIAGALADEGCRVVIAGRNEAKLAAAAEARSQPPELLYHTVDVADRGSVVELVDKTIERLGRIDILVNGAGMNIKNRGLAEMRPEQWDEIIAVNLTGAYNCLIAALPHMRSRGDGLVLNISSVAGKRAMLLGGVAYDASKFGMTALGACAWQEEAEHGIRVTNIYPGEVDTPLLDVRPNPVSDTHRAGVLQIEDLGAIAVALAKLPPHAHVPELVIKPLQQMYA